MSPGRTRIALDVYAARAELEEAVDAASAADPSDDAAWQAAATREMNARAAYLLALESHFAAVHCRAELAQSIALAVCQLTF